MEMHARNDDGDQEEEEDSSLPLTSILTILCLCFSRSFTCVSSNVCIITLYLINQEL